MRFGFGNALAPWEVSVSAALEKSSFYRVHLSAPGAWALHCPNHQEGWLSALPNIVQYIEDGCFPPEQAGLYDLVLTAWQRMIHYNPRPKLV